MKKLILVANTRLPDLEKSVCDFIEKQAKKDKELDYVVLYGRAEHPPHVYHKQIVIMLGTETYKVNADFINAGAVGIIMSDPMTLGCIQGKGVIRFDFESKGENKGFILKNHPSSHMVKCLKACFKKSKTPPVTTKVLEHIPNTLVASVLSSVKETTTFAKDFAALNYSVRNIADRDRIRRAVFKWVLSPNDLKVLKKDLKSIIGKDNAAVRNLCDNFDPATQRGSKSHAIRQGLITCFNLVNNKKAVIPFEKIGNKYHVSPYDLKYATFLFKGDPLLLESVTSTVAHYNNSKARNAQPSQEVST